MPMFNQIRISKKRKMLIEMQHEMDMTAEVKFDQKMKETILKLAKESYENVKNCWTGEECFSCSLMHEFFENLIHLHCKQITQILRRKIHQHFYSDIEESPKTCINNKFCFNFDSLQWKNNQKSAILSILENMLTMMISSSCKSAKANERDDTLLDLEYEVNCSCPKCKDNQFRSDRVIKGRDCPSQEVDYNSLKKIEDCIKESNSSRDNEKHKLQKIFELLREQRKQTSKAKSQKKHKHDLIFNLYGNLLGLDKEKYIQESMFEQLEKRKAKIYDELLKKNAFNQRIIKRFNRKMHLQKNQDKISNRKSLDIPMANSAPECSSSRIRVKKDKSQNSTTVSTPPFTSRLLHRASVSNRQQPNKSNKMLDPIINIQQTITHFTRLQESVEKTLKNFEPRQQKRVSILKSIVFNATDVFMTERQPMLRPNIDRPYFNRFQRVLKSSREMTKFGFRRSFDGIAKTTPMVNSQ